MRITCVLTFSSLYIESNYRTRLMTRHQFMKISSKLCINLANGAPKMGRNEKKKTKNH